MQQRQSAWMHGEQQDSGAQQQAQATAAGGMVGVAGRQRV